MSDLGRFYAGLAAVTLFVIGWDFLRKGGGR